MEMHIDYWSLALSIFFGLALAGCAGFLKFAAVKKKENPDLIIIIPAAMTRLGVMAIGVYLLHVIEVRTSSPVESILTQLLYGGIAIITMMAGARLLWAWFPLLKKDMKEQ